MKMKRTWAMVAAIVLSMSLALGSTLAYLSDTDSAVNVMTLGNVDIEQIELERKEQTNSGKDELQTFTQDKPLYPAVGEIKWAENNTAPVYQEWPTGGSSALYDSGLKNVVDKMVFVENTGKSDAYVRTIFAFEAGSMNAQTINNQLIHWNLNSTDWQWTAFDESMSATIKGAKYYFRIATYIRPNDETNAAGVLSASATTRPSLLQVFLDKTADNDLCASFGDTYQILTLSQAVQVNGFEDKGAEYALNEAFSAGQAPTAAQIAEWFGEVTPPFDAENADTSWYEANKDTKTYTIQNGNELAALSKLVAEGNDFSGWIIKLGTDIDLQGSAWTPIGRSMKLSFKGTFDGQGHTVSNFNVNVEESAGLFGYAMANIKNVTVKNATITATNYAGGVVGNGYVKVDNCHAENVEVTVNPILKDGVYDDGAKAGGVVGICQEGGQSVTNCSAKNVTINGYRDLGGVIGMIHYGNTFTGNTAENVTINLIEATPYVSDTPHGNLGKVYGRVGVKADGVTTDVSDVEDNDDVTINAAASTTDELKAALKVGCGVTLNNSVSLENGIAPADGTVLNLNGNTITDSSTDGRAIGVQKGAKVTVNGPGGINKDPSVTSNHAMAFYVSNGELTVNGGTYNMGTPSGTTYSNLIQNTSKVVINDGTFTNTANHPLFYVIWSSTLEINGGHFESIGAENPDLLDIEYHYNRISTITIKGGTFVNYDPSKDNEGDRVVVAQGYKVVFETKDNGDIWYTVVPE